jgi:GT2 family glycosyltransferase
MQVFERRDCVRQTGPSAFAGADARALAAFAGDRRPGFTVVVRARRVAAFDQLVHSLRPQTIPTDQAEVVISGGPRLSSAADPLVNELGDPWRVRFVDTCGTTLAHEWNLAARVASYELLLFLAEDFIPGPTWLASHLRLHVSRPEPSVVGLGPLLVDPSTPPGSFSRWLEETGRLRDRGLDPPAIGAFHAANTSMKRSFLLAAGGFDEAFPHDTTYDFELGLRMRQLGLQTISLSDAAVFRTSRISLAQQWRRMREAGESAVVLRLRHLSDVTLSAQLEGGWSMRLRRALAASLRWLAWHRRLDRELAWHHFLGAAFASGLERGLARFAGKGHQLPALPRPSIHELPMLQVLAGGRDDCGWAADPDEPIGVGGLKPVNVFDGYGVDAEENGIRCLSFRNPGGAPQAYFAIDRFHGLTERTLDIEFDILRGPEGTSVRVEYDSTDRSVRRAPDVPGAFKETTAQAVAAGHDWQTLRFAIDDARFCRSLHGADFRVVSSGPPKIPLVLRRARVSVRESDRTKTSFGTSTIEFAESSAPQVSIIIPTRDRLDLLRQCLQALYANTPMVYEVIVVDDGSPEGTLNSLDNVAGLRTLRLPVNVGFAHACNAGAAQARAPLLLFLNDDTVPLMGWLEPMLAALEQDARVGVVGSRLLYPRLGLVQHAGVDIDPTGQPFHLYRLEPSETPEVNEDRILPAVTGACLLIRRGLFEKLHGFDVVFRNGYEDIDLCLRARETGALTLYCNRSILLHYESASEGRMAGDSANNQVFLSRWGNRASGDSQSLTPDSPRNLKSS